MSKPRALQDLMTDVDAGRVVDVHVDSEKLIVPPRRSSYGRGWKNGARPPAAAAAETSSDTSFEFSAVASYSSASPASMVFSDGQLRAHQFPAVRSSAGSSQAASPVRSRSASVGSSGRSKASGAMGSKKRVSFATDGADKAAAAKAGGGPGKKSGGLLGCMGSKCGSSSRNEVVDPARNANRKVVAV